jgi:hypothetical protein
MSIHERREKITSQGVGEIFADQRKPINQLSFKVSSSGLSKGLITSKTLLLHPNSFSFLENFRIFRFNKLKTHYF